MKPWEYLLDPTQMDSREQLLDGSGFDKRVFEAKLVRDAQTVRVLVKGVEVGRTRDPKALNQLREQGQVAWVRLSRRVPLAANAWLSFSDPRPHKRPARSKARETPKSAYARKKKSVSRRSGGKKGMSHSAKPDDLRTKAPNGEVEVRKMTDEDRARFEARRGTGK